MSDSVRPHRRQPTRLPHPWDSPGKNTGVGCHFLLPCMKVKSESEVTQSCPTLSDPMDCSLTGSSVLGIFQARVLEWGAIAFSAAVVINFCNSCWYLNYLDNLWVKLLSFFFYFISFYFLTWLINLVDAGYGFWKMYVLLLTLFFSWWI